MMQQEYWWVVGGLVALAVLASVADRRRNRRRDYDNPGFMPWALIQILSLIGALMVTIVILHD
ncbi:hypothetical protein P1X14_20075 [Sphingomonas sp. AOB5]|uniref:hypothetical protein n=1 Tax=Sphingomonas sp. AOB5 TaxID=3034017 RepID=UPI0023F92B0C|nr:hypothetical protein [Sphingomonas sp. AOB5]MDF7777564.1 hypothetical protein [Sphingomonas sp. AOB5]